MNNDTDALAVFTARLYSEWLPAFGNDPARGFGTDGFKADSIRIGPLDADNFLRAIDGGLVADTGGGRYRCAQSKALEQLFWTHEKGISPRPLTLWVEPVIGMATLARIHFDLGWPAALLGMQTVDWAFDLAAYRSEAADRLVIACEVKKSRAEIDHLVADLRHHSREEPNVTISPKQRHTNSFRKWASLRRERPRWLWLVGPEGYEFVFALEHGDDTTTLAPAVFGDLRFSSTMPSA